MRAFILSRLDLPASARRAMVWRGIGHRLIMSRYTGVLAALAGFCVYLTIRVPLFASWANWENIFREAAVIYVVAVGSTLVVIIGGLDLSVGAMVAASGMAAGLVIEHGGSYIWGGLAAIACGLSIGLVNGLLIGVLRIPFIIVTLGTLAVFTSAALLSTTGQTISFFVYPQANPLQNLVNGDVGPLPNVLILGAVVGGLGSGLLHMTKFGRSAYAIGSNARAARLSGLRLTLTTVVVYAMAGALCGLGGVIQIGQLGAAVPQVDPNVLVSALAAVLIGGTSFDGGDGGLLGTAIGVIFLGVVQNGLTLLQVSSFWQGTFSGLILIVAVGLNVLRGEKGNRLSLRVSARARRLPMMCI
jgi:ribose transport system permease protein